MTTTTPSELHRKALEAALEAGDNAYVLSSAESPLADSNRAAITAYQAAIGAEPVAGGYRADESTDIQQAWSIITSRTHSHWLNGTEGHQAIMEGIQYGRATPQPPEGRIDGWRPIETAPKDSSDLILLTKDGTLARAKWVPFDMIDDGTWYDDYTDFAFDPREAIGWMPLPAPPALSPPTDRSGE